MDEEGSPKVMRRIKTLKQDYDEIEKKKNQLNKFGVFDEDDNNICNTDSDKGKLKKNKQLIEKYNKISNDIKNLDHKKRLYQ